MRINETLPTDREFSECSSTDVTLLRKPLSFILPILHESQAEKNPFKRNYIKASSLKMDRNPTTEIAKSGSNANGLKKTGASTPAAQGRAKASLEKTPKPSLFSSEPADEAEQDNHSMAAAVKEEKKIDTKERLPEYEVVLTREILYNFKELDKIGLTTLQEINNRSVILPEVKGRSTSKTLILDLDDTLMHTMDPQLNYSSLQMDSDAIKQVRYADPLTTSLVSTNVVIRPGAAGFLKEVRSLYEVVVILSCYNNEIIDIYSGTKKLCAGTT